MWFLRSRNLPSSFFVDILARWVLPAGFRGPLGLHGRWQVLGNQVPWVCRSSLGQRSSIQTYDCKVPGGCYWCQKSSIPDSWGWSCCQEPTLIAPNLRWHNFSCKPRWVKNHSFCLSIPEIVSALLGFLCVPFVASLKRSKMISIVLRPQVP